VQIARFANHAGHEIYAGQVQMPLESRCSFDKTSDAAGPRIMARSRLHGSNMLWTKPLSFPGRKVEATRG
jgi:hypothetical protein